jgi:hypothetical protein
MPLIQESPRRVLLGNPPLIALIFAASVTLREQLMRGCLAKEENLMPLKRTRLSSAGETMEEKENRPAMRSSHLRLSVASSSGFRIPCTLLQG